MALYDGCTSKLPFGITVIKQSRWHEAYYKHQHRLGVSQHYTWVTFGSLMSKADMTVLMAPVMTPSTSTTLFSTVALRCSDSSSTVSCIPSTTYTQALGTCNTPWITSRVSALPPVAPVWNFSDVQCSVLAANPLWLSEWWEISLCHMNPDIGEKQFFVDGT